MVHDKKRSGDPDFDDKVPIEQQLGETVKGPDGQEVLVTESTGPTNPDGTHADLTGATDEQDNRPAPGDVATEPSTVQTYDRDDVAGAAKGRKTTGR